MATKQHTPRMATFRGEWLRVSEDVFVTVNLHRDDTVMLKYTGPARALIATGICSETMLAPKRRGKPYGRVDADRHEYHFDRYRTARGEQRYRIWWCSKPRVSAERLPGARKALESIDVRLASLSIQRNNEAEPITADAWKEQQISVMARLLRAVTTFVPDDRFRFVDQDLLRLQELGAKINSEFYELATSMRVEDRDAPPVRRLRLATDNGRLLIPRAELLASCGLPPEVTS
jgi:hypothetical protein